MDKDKDKFYFQGENFVVNGILQQDEITSRQPSLTSQMPYEITLKSWYLSPYLSLHLLMFRKVTLSKHTLFVLGS